MKRSSLIVLLALLSACVPHPHRHKKTPPPTTSPPVTAEPVTEPSTTTTTVAVQSTVTPTTRKITPTTTHAPVPSAGGRALTSTAYCERGTTASGQQTHSGIAAANELPMGSSWKVLETGEVVTIEDRSAPGATQLDVWMPSCSDAVNWGRRTVHVVPA